MSAYRWKAKIPDNLAPPCHWHLTESDWNAFCRFLQHARWKADPSATTAYIELAALFVFRGFTFSVIDKEITTFKELNGHLRRPYTMIQRMEGSSPFPGCQTSTKSKCWGRSLPAGVFAGCQIHWNKIEFTWFAKLLQGGAGAKLASWAFPIAQWESY